MKHFLISFVLLVATLPILSQENKFSGMHGLYENNGRLVLKYRAYSIYITTTKGKLDDGATMEAFKKEFDMPDSVKYYTDPAIDRENIVIEYQAIDGKKPGMKKSISCYFFVKSEDEILRILFQTLGNADIEIEHDIIDSYFLTGLNEYISESKIVKSIDFAGREVDLGNNCRWRGPNNLYCGGGQISWSEFPSYDEAEDDIITILAANDSPDRVILSDEDLDVIFEGVPTIARRIVYENPQNVYSLAVYYLAQEVRGRAVSCVFSTDVYSVNDYNLPSLLQHFISIPNLPENAYTESDYYSEPTVYHDQPEEGPFPWSKYNMSCFEIQAGTWLPLGALRHTYKVAPSVGMYLGIPFNDRIALDLGMYAAFPIQSKHFDYYRGQYILNAKIHALLGVNLRLRFQQELSKNWYLTPYIGIGAHGLITNLKKNHDEDSNYEMTTLDAFGGINLRYKSFGIFVEYHQVPYSISDRVRSDFGNSVINTGLMFAF